MRTLSPQTQTLCAAIGALSVLSFWQLIVVMGIITPILLPSPVVVIESLLSMLTMPTFYHDLSSTIYSWSLGVAFGSVFGGLLGLLIGMNRYVYAAVEPCIEFLRSLPSVVLVPLVSLFLGTGSGARFVSCTLVVIVLMVSTSAAAVSSIRTSHLRLALAWRANRQQMFWHFYLPGTLTQMAIALRAAIPLALIVTVAADMIVATDAGLGRIVMDALAVLDTSRLYAAVFVIGTIGYGATFVASRLGKVVLHWSSV